MSKQTEALKLALEALERLKRAFFKSAPDGIEEWESEWVVPAMSAITAICEALAEQPASEPLTDEQITAGARALCKQMAEACGVDARDQWQLYADTFKEDAKAVLEAANNVKGNI